MAPANETPANETRIPDLELTLSDRAGVAWCLNGDDGPRTRRLDPARAVTRWYLRGKTGVEELFLQLYFGRLSVADVDAVTSVLWGKNDGTSLVHEAVPGIMDRINRWLQAPAQYLYPYIFLHSVDLRSRRPGQNSGTRIAAAVGINQLGYRETLGVVAVAPEGGDLWERLLGALTARGVRPPRLVVGGGTDPELRKAVETHWRGCGFLMPVSELAQGLLDQVRSVDFQWVDRGLAELNGCPSRSEAERVTAKLREKLRKAGYAHLSENLGEKLRRHLACFDIPRTHGLRLRSANLVRSELNRVREQARVLGAISDENALVLLTAATFRQQGRNSWETKPFLHG